MCNGNIEQIDAKMVFDAYREHDGVAVEVINRFKSYLAIGIGGIINNIDPGVISLGGGLCKSSDILLDNLKSKVREHILYKNEEFADIVIANLGNDAGIIGAAMLS